MAHNNHHESKDRGLCSGYGGYGGYPSSSPYGYPPCPPAAGGYPPSGYGYGAAGYPPTAYPYNSGGYGGAGMGSMLAGAFGMHRASHGTHGYYGHGSYGHHGKYGGGKHYGGKFKKWK